MAGIYGYFTSAGQSKPEYDPGLDGVPCPICSKDLDPGDVRTISLMVPKEWFTDGKRVSVSGDRSYFYRVHKSCHEPLSEVERSKVDSLLIDAICSTKNTN